MENCGIHFAADDAPRKFKRYFQYDQILELLVRMRREVARARPRRVSEAIVSARCSWVTRTFPWLT